MWHMKWKIMNAIFVKNMVSHVKSDGSAFSFVSVKVKVAPEDKRLLVSVLNASFTCISY